VILQAGKNCWRIDRADRISCVQDGADYFRLVRQAILGARNTIFILGWDITAHIDLLPGTRAPDAPTRLDKLLVHVARRRPELRCYILIWDYGVLHTLERDPFSRWRLGWRMPRGVRFGFDDHHPVGGCHHQKVVVIDDQLAFCGGIDLTGHRWDTSAHRVDEPERRTILGKAYGPYHEIQAMASGPVAASLGALARDRWRTLGVERLPPVRPSTDDHWPADVTPDLSNVGAGISRTVPPSETQPAIRECEALFLDSIAQARRAIYIESQYFTSDTLAVPLAARLKEPDGPEVIVVTPRECQGWLEHNTMGAFRDGVFRKLAAADAHKRLRIVYPSASRTHDLPTFVHSKVMVVDDTLARIGSANFSERSLGVDTECDLAVEAGGDSNARAQIRCIRDRLIAEHLDLPVAAVARDVERGVSLRALIDARAHGDHTLVPIEIPAETTAPSEILRAAADPDEPIAFGAAVEYLVPAVDAAGYRTPLRLWILPAIALMAAAPLVWGSLPIQGSVHAIEEAPPALWIGAAVFLVAGLLLVPLELLAIAAGVFFGAARGAVVALAGSMAAAAIGYAVGRAIGATGLTRWVSRKSYRSVQQMGARGITGIIMLHVSAVASAGAIHLLCGAGRVAFGTFITGTAIGLLPVIAALGGLGALLRDALLHPSISSTLVAIGAAVALIVVAAGLRTLLLIQQFAPAISGHRERAEFG
jgi:phosphatidylserine/phosphatidylglycerophosphate/cardiolipin synthase-like enzyme/uncharacterized membrane protein YdjX (TVP38/TMEM64 family)